MVQPNGQRLESRPHAVLVPFPAQGHVTPLLQLAKKLVAYYDFRVTFVNTDYVHERVMKSRKAAGQPDIEGIEFIAIPDGLPDDDPRLRDMTTFCAAQLDLGPTFEELLTTLLKKSPITCLIMDVLMTPAAHAAHKFNIPVAMMPTPSAISVHCCFHLNTLTAAGVLPTPPPPEGRPRSVDSKTLRIALPQSEAEAAARSAPLTCIPGCSPTMRVENMPTFAIAQDFKNYFTRFFRDHQNPSLSASACVLFNSCEALEGPVLKAQRACMNKNVFGVGPLVLDTAMVNGVEEVSVAGSGSGLWEEDPVSLTWLDGHKPNSVLFVSFGSIAMASAEQVREFAAGLESTNVPFLWVFRPDLLDDSPENRENHSKFSEFVDRTRDRGLLVPWVPQTAVLSHPAVGAFLSHCGWNSTVESISCGVPLLAWPQFTDQITNTHYLTSVWKVGLFIQKTAAKDGSVVVLKEEIARKVKKIMGIGEAEDLEIASKVKKIVGVGETEDVEIDEIRRNVRNLQREVKKAVATGGSSQKDLGEFVKLITSFTKK